MEETAKWVGECSVLLTKYCAGDKIKKNEMGGACSAYGVEERCIQVVVGKPESKNH